MTTWLVVIFSCVIGSVAGYAFGHFRGWLAHEQDVAFVLEDLRSGALDTDERVAIELVARELGL